MPRFIQVSPKANGAGADKAIVTLAIGERYAASWRQYCEANWTSYARHYGYDLIVLDEPLDTSERARRRSAAWQKCLVLSQDFSLRYERIVWVDCDIMINNRTAPDIAKDVPLEKIGMVEEGCFSRSEPRAARIFIERAYELWPGAIINVTAQDYYSRFGLPGDCDVVANTGVMVLSPRHHREVLERVYNTFEDKGGREWHMEMRPLSYVLIKENWVHWLDVRFNLMWPFEEIVRYPFSLQTPARRPSRLQRIVRAFTGLWRSRTLRTLRAASLNATFQVSFFFHLGGMNTGDMSLVKTAASSWWDVLPW